MSLSVTVLGSSGRYATADRACAGYLVELDDTRLLLDAGGGTWMNLMSLFEYDDIDAVLLTHRHPDHVIDLFQAYHAREFGPAGDLDPIPLWAPQETIDRILGFAPEVDESFDLRPVQPGDTVTVGPASLRLFEMAHPPDTVGVRIEHEDAVVAYTADTGPSADLVSLASGADLLICEATLQNSDESWEGHMKAVQAGEAAAQCGVEKLVLTHLPASRDLGLTLAEAQAACEGIAVQLAEDRQRHEVR